MGAFVNITWILFGGLFIAIEYLIASLILMLSIIGIPYGKQTLKLAARTLKPFGDEKININKSPGPFIINLIWLLIGGIWISLSHLFLSGFFALTVIGKPFAKQHFMMAEVALTPFGRG